MKQWQQLRQDEVDDFGKELCGQMEKEVLDKCEVAEKQRGSHTGRRNLQERQIKAEETKCRSHKVERGWLGENLLLVEKIASRDLKL